MSGKIILSAYLPLATSVNAMYDSRKRLTPAARSYKEYCATILKDYKNSECKNQYNPYYVYYQDDDAIATANFLKENKGKTKALLSLHKRYCVEVLVVYPKDLRDLDNQYKLMQDTIADFLCVNDRKVMKITQYKEVDSTAPPHVEVIVRIEDGKWRSGWLMEVARSELQMENFYKNYGESNGEIDNMER